MAYYELSHEIHPNQCYIQPDPEPVLGVAPAVAVAVADGGLAARVEPRPLHRRLARQLGQGLRPLREPVRVPTGR